MNRFWFRRLLIQLILRRFRVPRDAVRFAFSRYPDRIAIITRRGSLTYSRLADRVYRLASGWHAAGVRKGDHVYTQLADDWEQIETRLAAFELGAILTPFNEAHPSELILDASQIAIPRVFVFDPQFAKTAELLSDQHPSMLQLKTGEHGAYETLIAGSPAKPSTNYVKPRDIAALGFTSGTTGKPKALFVNQSVALISLRLMTANLNIGAAHQDIFLVCIPLVGAGSGAVLPALIAGSTMLIPPSYDVSVFIPWIEKYKATRAFMTPSQLIDVLDWPDLARYDISSLKNLIYGTAPMPAAKLEEAIVRIGPILQQGYGMAEVLPPVSLLQMQQHVHNGEPASRHILSSAGKVVNGVKVQIVDERSQPLKSGEIGEIIIQSPTVFSGYWHRSDLTSNALQDGWYHSSDYGFFDEFGLLYVLDRKPDLIERENRTIYPRLVEEAVHDHPAVKEACLVKANDSSQIILFVSLREQWRTPQRRWNLAEEISNFLCDKVQDWQMPDKVMLIDEMPRSFLRKMLRKDLRDLIPKHQS
jgi:fatty-acyl-CoA synthase